MAESDEFSPLIQRHVNASAAELRTEAAEQRAEAAAQAAAQLQLLKSELKSDIQEINQRSLRMEAQLLELFSRAGAS
jgi:predicted  nucleic acid-binding Zn-ribbon protein